MAENTTTTTGPRLSAKTCPFVPKTPQPQGVRSAVLSKDATAFDPTTTQSADDSELSSRGGLGSDSDRSSSPASPSTSPQMTTNSPPHTPHNTTPQSNGVQTVPHEAKTVPYRGHTVYYDPPMAPGMSGGGGHGPQQFGQMIPQFHDHPPRGPPQPVQLYPAPFVDNRMQQQGVPVHQQQQPPFPMQQLPPQQQRPQRVSIPPTREVPPRRHQVLPQRAAPSSSTPHGPTEPIAMQMPQTLGSLPPYIQQGSQFGSMMRPQPPQPSMPRNIGNNSSNEGAIVELNIGGRVFHTTRKTLLSQEEPNYFTKLLNDPSNTDGSFFIDRDPEYFAPILSYLRTNQLPTLPHGVSYDDIAREAMFYQIQLPPYKPRLDTIVQLHGHSENMASYCRTVPENIPGITYYRGYVVTDGDYLDTYAVASQLTALGYDFVPVFSNGMHAPSNPRHSSSPSDHVVWMRKSKNRS